MERIKISKEWVETLEKYEGKLLQDGYGIFGYNSVKTSTVIKFKKNLWGKVKSKTFYYLEDINFLCNYKGKIGTFKEDYIKRIFLLKYPSFISDAREFYEKMTETLSLFGYEVVKKEEK